ncbi:flagellar hook-length control protein FliK [Mitsuaria sp. WAJ17]|uniref:flagellar hook-length control protein FliK n=1 Tax=Mitsuaria sp. WAJ17 TaxID=2761452 RepID=UPI001603876B|nr:flagellar hook-length control protein FliK [Mitsuaria sp. WAJ17]MBB2486537.1 flagellar hook-length control protein FliK [Mitsuaria sp. WAJ17]
MNKMMLTPSAGSARSATADLLSQLGSARGGQDGEASAAFAQLLQAKGGTVSVAPVTLSPRQPASPGNPPPTPLPGSSQVAAPAPRAAAPAPSPAKLEGETSRSAASDQARRLEARAAGRRTAEAQTRDRQGQAANGTKATAETSEADAQDPVLAQVLRHLRKDDSPADAELDPAAAQDSATEAQDKPADASLTAAVPQAQIPAQIPAQDAQKPLPAGDAALAPAAPLGRHAALNADGDGGQGGQAEGARIPAAGDGKASELPAGTLGAAAAQAQPQGPAGARSAQELSARPDENARALDATAQAAKAGDGPAHDTAALPAGFAGMLHQAQAGALQERGTAAAAAAGARYELQSPLHSPGFAPEMAARLSLAAAEGVQQAQLHLNPSEMGPVQVQIVLDGQQAQISFVAEQADTRAVLEKRLPELAGALRDQGLTLSGGGVFSQQQQAQSGQADRDGSASGGRWTAAAADRMPGDDSVPTQQHSATQARRSRGVLDLFA